MAVGVAQEIWRQIPLGVKMSLGMRDARIVDGSLEVRVGPMRPQRRLTVTLNSLDLYDLQLHKLKPGPTGQKSFVTWELEDSYDCLYADQLGEVMLWMESKNWG